MTIEEKFELLDQLIVDKAAVPKPLQIDDTFKDQIKALDGQIFALKYELIADGYSFADMP